MRTKALAIGVALALGVTACGADGGSNTRSPDDAIIQIHLEGGFAPPDWLLARGPIFTLTGDGRLIYEGPVIAIFPGPLLPNYQMTQLTGDDVDQLLTLVNQMGLPGIVDEVDNSALDFLADAGTDVITYWDQNGAHRYGVYALGFEEEPEREATRVFAELRSVLDQLAGAGESHPYVGEQARVVVGEGVLDPEFQDVRDWPFPGEDIEGWQVVADAWRCKVLASDVLSTFDDATKSTLWRAPDSGGASDLLKVLVRPLHPGEPGCPDDIG
ncbi:MAG: hypothetical protein L0Z47_07890 [Actinobacteria bacterium]|nr:hypothetical protein [Actinomycetota bacterium]